MITVLNVLGIPDNNVVKIVHNNGDMKQFTYEVDGNSNIITNRQFNNVQIVTIFFGGKHQNIELNVGDDVLVFNSISNPDSSKNALNSLSNFIQQTMLPTINYPSSILKTSRDEIYKNLKDLDSKITIPRCERITPNSINDVKKYIETNLINYPVIFRTTADHGSENMIKIASVSDLHNLEQFAFNGKNDFYIIEYIDYKSEDNYYRKVRYWIIGDVVIPRHKVISNNWNISYDEKVKMMKDNLEFQREEKEFIEKNNPILKNLCLKIKNSLNLDYFGIDCSVDENDNILIFEITPAMALVEDKFFPYTHSAFIDAENALIKLIENKSKKITL